MRRVIVTLALAAVAGAALAGGSGNSAATPGTVIAPVETAVAPAVDAPMSSKLDPEQLARLVAGAEVGLGGSAVKPAPPVLVVERGVTAAIPISAHHLNRFRTPLRELRIETTSEAQIKREGGSFYIATDGPEPVALFVIDRDNPDNAVSLLLKPYELPPADVRLELPWATLQPPAPGREVSGWDPTQPYVATLARLLRGLAQHEVPAGYRIETMGDRRNSPLCDFAGLRIEPLQRIEGHALVALVARVSNPGAEPVAIDESACSGPGVLAIAAWPRVRLEPSDETELFIALRPAETAPAGTRPSVLHLPTR